MSDSIDTVLEKLQDTGHSFEDDLKKVTTANELEETRIKYLGRKGQISQYFKQMGSLSPNDRPKLGDALNKLKTEIHSKLESAKHSLASNQNGSQEEYLDLTLPGAKPSFGYRNPLLQVMDEIKDIFQGMGFRIETGPLVENEYYNFTALNVPEDHPSKDLQDTFYLEHGLLLRTHTSPVQIRTMEKQKPPIRIIAPGRCFRKDTPDATHSPEFHQVEGLVVDTHTSFKHLKGTLFAFAQKLFGPETRVRFRPSFFPFTEPSAEMDIYFDEKLGWLEILGSGMVDPNVLSGVGIDPKTYSGFAFGMGVERIAMLKYRIDDIRHFYDNDLRFLAQF